MRHRVPLQMSRVVAAAGGGSLAAACRYQIADQWHSQIGQLMTTLVVTLIASWSLCVISFKIESGNRVLQAFAIGFFGTLDSVSAYVASGIEQLPWAAAGYLLLTPAVAALGAVFGPRAVTHMARRRARTS